MKEKLLKRIEYLSDKYENENDFLFQLKNLVFNLDIQDNVIRETKTFENLLLENLDSIQSNEPCDNLIKTGFDNIDEVLGGFSLGEYVVIGSRPSFGKTQLLINLALHISQIMPVLFYSLNLSGYILMNRFISTLTKISIQKIHQKDLSEEELQMISTVKKELSKYKLFFNDSPNSSIDTVKEICSNQINENNVKVIILDYLQLMSSYRYRKHRELEVGHISRELKKIAKENNVCVIVTSQLSRSVEMRYGAKRPQLSDLRESGAIEQDADKVLLVHRPEQYGFIEDEEGNSLLNIVELIIAKNRNGKIGDVRLCKDIHFTTLKDAEAIPEDFTFSNDRLNELSGDAPF